VRGRMGGKEREKAGNGEHRGRGRNY